MFNTYIYWKMGSFTKMIRVVIVLSVPTISLALRVNNIYGKLCIYIVFSMCLWHLYDYFLLLFVLNYVCAILIMHLMLWQNKDVTNQSEYHMDDGNVLLDKWLSPCTFRTITSSTHNYNSKVKVWIVVHMKCGTMLYEHGSFIFWCAMTTIQPSPTHNVNVQIQGALQCNFTTLENYKVGTMSCWNIERRKKQ